MAGSVDGGSAERGLCGLLPWSHTAMSRVQAIIAHERAAAALEGVNSEHLPPVNTPVKDWTPEQERQAWEAKHAETFARLDGDVNSETTVPVNTLSAYQRSVLLATLKATCYWSEHSERMRREVKMHGVHLGRRHNGTSRAISAARSRAIRRLEERGLICRINDVSGDKYWGTWSDSKQTRTVYIRLTALGRRTAEVLKAAE